MLEWERRLVGVHHGRHYPRGTADALVKGITWEEGQWRASISLTTVELGGALCRGHEPSPQNIV